MNMSLGIIFLAAIAVGVYSALEENNSFKNGKIKGIKSSKNLISYLFLDHD